MTIKVLQDIYSTKLEFGECLAMSADNSTMVIFNEKTEFFAKVDVYIYDTSQDKFVFYDSQDIQNEGGLGSQVIIAQDGSYIITNSDKELNATACLFRINTKDKTLLTVYKVCEFSLTNVQKYGAYQVGTTGSSDYLTLCDNENIVEFFVWDSDLRNYRSIQQISLYRYRGISPQPSAVLSEDGQTGIIICNGWKPGWWFNKGRDPAFVAYTISAQSNNGKNNTVSNYGDLGDKKIIADVGGYYPAHIYSSLALRSTFNGLVCLATVSRGITSVNKKTNNIELNGNPYREKTFSSNFNGGLIPCYSDTYNADNALIFRLKESSFPRKLEVNNIFSENVTATSGFIVKPSSKMQPKPVSSDSGYCAFSFFDNKDKRSVVRVYKDDQYPNFYIPSGYPTISVKDLKDPEKTPQVDSTLFTVTYTFKE